MVRRTKKYFSQNGGIRYGYQKAFIWERDNRKCVECGTKKNTIIHHIIPYDKDNEFTTNPSNMVVMCKKCHSWVHDQGKKERQFKVPSDREKLKEIGFIELLKDYRKLLVEIKNG